jgi:signal transduction histidine kinase
MTGWGRQGSRHNRPRTAGPAPPRRRKTGQSKGLWRSAYQHVAALMTMLADNPLVRAVGRVPTTVQRKLLVAFAGIVGLLVILGVLGLRELAASNDLVVSLGRLPQRVATYRELQIDTGQLGPLLNDRNGYVTGIGCDPSGCGPLFPLSSASSGVAGPANPQREASAITADDATIQLIIARLAPLTNVTGLGFVPPPEEMRILIEIHAEFAQFYAAMSSMIAKDQAGQYSPSVCAFLNCAVPTGPTTDETIALRSNADRLVSIAQADTANLIDDSQVAYLDSQHLVIGVAAGSILLALLLGVVLSGSLIVPIKQVRARLAAIASGDFSGHLDVPNRDELGALAADLNRMNDQLESLYRELETASQHKSEFLANMSHELRTPLNAVIGFSEVLQQRLFGDLNDKQAEYVTDIQTSGRHLLTLINDILDLSKIEAGRMELEVAAFAISDVLENAVALTRERATRQGISLRLEVDPSAGTVAADERKIKQVLYNLLTNAVKFTARGGHVEVTARGDGDEVLVSVTDDGIGIAAADQARIFDEFQQVSRSQVQEGTGLGLALSRRFVELHRGRLWVESGSGQGSTFAFTLPRTQRTGAGAKASGLFRPEAAGVAGGT